MASSDAAKPSDAISKIILPLLPKGNAIDGESELQVITNAFKIYKKDTVIHQYKIQFTKKLITESASGTEVPLFEETDKKFADVLKFKYQKYNRKLMKVFIDSFPAIFPGGMRAYCYDNSTNIYSLQPIVPAAKQLELTVFKSSKILKENCQLFLNIQPLGVIDLKDTGNEENGYRFLKTLFINSSFRLHHLLHDEKFFCDDVTRILPIGFRKFGVLQKLYIGVIPNIITTEDSAALTVDVFYECFYPSLNLYEISCHFFHVEKTDILSISEYNFFNSFLDGLICFFKFGDNKNVPILLSGHNNSRADTVVMKHNGEYISLTRYYAIVYKYKIKYRYWPLAVSTIDGKQTVYPLECLTLAPGQSVTNLNMPPKKYTLLIECWQLPNDTKLTEIKEAPKLFNTNKGEICKRMELSLNKSLLRVDAQLLSAPDIIYDNKIHTPTSDGKWKISSFNTKYIDARKCNSWKAVLLECNSMSLRKFKSFVRQYWDIASEHEMKMEVDADYFHMKNMLPAVSIEATKKEIRAVFRDAVCNCHQFLLFGLDETETTLYNYIKWLEKETDILTQIIPIKHVKEALENQTPVILQIIAKTNIKLGGINYYVSTLNDPDCIQNLYIGIHVDLPSSSESSNNEASKYATIGICANDPTKSIFKHSGNFYIQSLEADKIEDVIHIMIKELFERLGKETYSKLMRIVVYRSGGGAEDETGQLLKEMMEIRKFLTSCSMSIPLSYITATEEKHLQFFSGFGYPENKNLNILPGTVIDRGVIGPTKNQFFLQCSLKNLLKFTITYTDERHADMAMFERWTHAFCFNTQVNSEPLDKPSLLAIAEKYASRGRKILESFFEHGHTFDSSDDLVHQTMKVNYTKNALLRDKNIVA